MINKLWDFYETFQNVILPAEGEIGYIEVSDRVFGVQKNSSQVCLEPKIVPMTKEQTWLRGITYDGYFTLTNPHYGKNIMQDWDSLTIEGISTLDPLIL